MNGERRRVPGRVALLCALLVAGLFGEATAQTKPEGEMRWALYVTLSPVWFDPGEVTGQLTPFWVLYALHDALVKPMPGNLMSPSLAESWMVSADQKTYEFKLREGLKFHEALYKQQALETDKKKREAMLHQIQRLVYERVRYGPIFEYIWPSGVGPRVAEPALMLINPYPWSAPLEEVRLKKP